MTGPERVEHRSHFAAGARLIATHPREADGMLAVGPLDESRAIKPVFRGPAPDVRSPERVERGLHDIGGVAGDRAWRLGRRLATLPPGGRPAPIDRLPDRHRQPDRGGDAIAGVCRGTPKAAWPDV